MYQAAFLKRNKSTVPLQTKDSTHVFDCSGLFFKKRVKKYKKDGLDIIIIIKCKFEFKHYHIESDSKIPLPYGLLLAQCVALCLSVQCISAVH